MKFTQEQIDFVKHCGEHFEVLTGGRGHSKTKQIIEQLALENQELKDRIDKALDKIQLLIDIGFDYDGFNKADSLKGLIDELVSYARDSRGILKGDKE